MPLFYREERDPRLPEFKILDCHKEKLRELFHFADQLLYSPVLVTGVTTARDVNHTNAVNRKRRKLIPHY